MHYYVFWQFPGLHLCILIRTRVRVSLYPPALRVFDWTRPEKITGTVELQNQGRHINIVNTGPLDTGTQEHLQKMLNWNLLRLVEDGQTEQDQKQKNYDDQEYKKNPKDIGRFETYNINFCRNAFSLDCQYVNKL